MRPLISEFSYGYALTEEIVSYHRHKMKVAPVFPSLYKEGKDGYGYDVSIDVLGIPIFLQFKLSDYMKGRKKLKKLYTNFLQVLFTECTYALAKNPNNMTYY
jgi:hypothetical protein